MALKLRGWCATTGLAIALWGCGLGADNNDQSTGTAVGNARPAAGSLAHPQTGSVWTEDDMARPLAWAPIARASKYHLYVGTGPGLNDVVDSGELPAVQTTFEPVLEGPLDTLLHARLHYLRDGTWYRLPDVSFRMAAQSAAIMAPRRGALVLGSDLTVRWEASPKASHYRIDVGTEPGLSDVAASPRLEASSRSYVAKAMPSDRPLYVRLSSSIDGAWKWQRDHLVTVSPSLPRLALLHPSAGAFDPTLPLRWAAAPGARHYRLRLGTSPGAGDLDDSGPIVVTERFAHGLVGGQRVFGTLSAWVNEGWIEQSFEFVVAAPGQPTDAEFDTAQRAAVQVRAMADAANAVFPGSFLESAVTIRRADCTHYARALLLLLQQANLSRQRRARGTCIVLNNSDCHTLVEIKSPSGAWQIIDPTFAISPVNVRTGAVLSVAGMSDAIRSAKPGVAYRAFDARALDRLHTYYLDYTLLFAQPVAVLAVYQPAEISVLHHYERRAEVRGNPGFYALRCAEGSATASAAVDGIVQDIGCNGVDRLTRVFAAHTIDAASTTAPPPEIHAPRRYTTGLPQQ